MGESKLSPFTEEEQILYEAIKSAAQDNMLALVRVTEYGEERAVLALVLEDEDDENSVCLKPVGRVYTAEEASHLRDAQGLYPSPNGKPRRLQ